MSGSAAAALETTVRPANTDRRHTTRNELRLLHDWAVARKWPILRGYIRAATTYPRNWGSVDGAAAVTWALLLLDRGEAGLTLPNLCDLPDGRAAMTAIAEMRAGVMRTGAGKRGSKDAAQRHSEGLA